MKRTDLEEIKLIETKELLKKKVKELGLDYDKLAASAKNFAEISERANNAMRDQSASRIDEQRKTIAENKRNLDQIISETKRYYGKDIRADSIPVINGIQTPGLGSYQSLLESRASEDARSKDADAERMRLYATEQQKKEELSGKSNERLIEQRFIEAQKRVAEIVNNYNSTLKKINQDVKAGKLKGSDILSARNDANDDFESRLDYEKQSLNRMYAEYIEDQVAASKLAIDRQTKDAIDAQKEALNAQFITAEEYEERIQRIKETNTRKNAQLYAESFQKTMQAAQATTTGIAQFIKAKDIGSSLSAQGNVLQGLSGFKEFAPALGVLGPIGAGIGALGGIFTTIFGDSEAKRAEAARQQAERDAAALKVLQNQEKHQKDLLEFQKAQANLPFKDLQRELRIIDIQAQQKRLSGGTADAVEAERLQRTSTAISGVLKSQSDTFTGGVFFNDSARSPEALSAALGDVDKYGPSMNLLSTIINDVAATRDTSGEKTGFDFYNQRMDRVRSLSLPPQLKAAALDFIASVAASAFYRTARDNGIADANLAYLAEASKGTMGSTYGAQIFRAAQGYEGLLGGRGINQSTSTIDSLVGEFTSDASKIENLLGLFERLNQTNIQIQENTKKTADSTTKLVETPTRTASLIDITRGVFRSLGQSITPRLPGPIGLPDGVRESVMAIDIHKSLQERSLNRLEDLVSIQRDSREFLAIISKALAEGQNPNSDWRIKLEDLYRRVIST